jgi:outer membrane protein assembly factor BamE (lipoprotein component of BamABCDE complex)
MKKPQLRFLVVAIAILAVSTGLLVMVVPSSGVSKENFARIKIGMTKTEVEAILGKPTAKSAQDNCSAWGPEQGNCLVR